MDKRAFNIVFPMGGLNRRYAYQQQPPYTTFDALNVRPDSTVEGRERGGSRPGLCKAFSNQIGGGNPVRMLSSVTWVQDGVSRTTLVAGANGNAYRLTNANEWETLGGGNRLLEDGSSRRLLEDGTYRLLEQSTIELAGDRPVMAQERLQKLYIADWGDAKAEGAGGSVSGTTLTMTETPNPVAAGVSDTNDVVTLTDENGDQTVYAILEVTTTNLTLAAAPGNGTYAYRVETAPKIYDPATNSAERWVATEGSVPAGCPLIALYRDRLVLAKEHVWYMSRQGAPLDYNYGADATDAQRAVAGSNSDAGLIGQQLRALISHSDDYLIFGCDSSLWLLQGDPASSGIIGNLSYTVGIVGEQAWCKTPDGQIIFLSRDGIYGLAPGAGNYPQSLSRERLPRELLDIDPDLVTVSMEYDVRERGIHLFLTYEEEPNAPKQHWWFDWETKGFWPVRLASTAFEPTTTYRLQREGEESVVLLGCRDGYVRQFHRECSDDDSQSFESYILLGPFRAGADDMSDGILSELVGVLDDASGEVDWMVHVGPTFESAINSSPYASGRWSAGLNYRERPRARGPAIAIVLRRGGWRSWALERINAAVTRLGVQRKL